MPLVSCEVSATVKFGDPLTGNNYFKVNFGIKDIDTEQDLKSQLEECAKAIRPTFAYLMEKLDKAIDDNVNVKIT